MRGDVSNVMKYFGWILNYSRIRSIRLKSVIHFSEFHFWKCISKCPIPNRLKISLHQFDAQESLWRQWKLKRKCSSEVKKIFFPRVLMDMQGGLLEGHRSNIKLFGLIITKYQSTLSFILSLGAIWFKGYLNNAF